MQGWAGGRRTEEGGWQQTETRYTYEATLFFLRIFYIFFPPLL